MSDLKEVLKAINNLYDAQKNLKAKYDSLTAPKEDTSVKRAVEDIKKDLSSIHTSIDELKSSKEEIVEEKEAQPTGPTTVHVVHEDYIPCRIWQFREEYNNRMRELEEQYHIDLEDATKIKKDVERTYKDEKEKVQKYFDKIILKEDETDPDYINPLRISNYQGRFVQLVQGVDGLVHRNDDGTFNVTLAKGPNTLVVGVCDGFDGDILKVYDSGFHYVTTAGLEEIRAGGFICPAKNKRGKVNYIQNASGSIDDIDKFRIPIGKIIGVDSSSETPSSVFCKLCD